MRAAWAVAAIAVVLAVAWWLAREPAREPPAGSGRASPPGVDSGRVLYRWRDDAGVLQITDAPPKGRRYDTVDVDALDRRNRFDPRPPEPAPQ